MKLSELRSAIRKMKGNPSIIVELTPGVPMTLVLQKTPLLEELGLRFAKDANTGLSITDEGVIHGALSYDRFPNPTCEDTFIALDEAMAPVPEFEDGEDVVTIVDDDEDML